MRKHVVVGTSKRWLAGVALFGKQSRRSTFVLFALVVQLLSACGSVGDVPLPLARGTAHEALVARAACDGFQQQRSGQTLFGVQAEDGETQSGTLTTSSLVAAYGGKALKFNEFELLRIPVTFREPGAYSVMLRVRSTTSSTADFLMSSSYDDETPSAATFAPAGNFAWLLSRTWVVDEADLHQAGALYIQGSNEDFELDAVAFRKDSTLDPDAAFGHVQKTGSDVLAIPAERVNTISDPNGDGKLFTVEDGGAAQGWDVLKAHSSANSETDQSRASYLVKFSAAGTYRIHLRVRTFSTGTDSLFVSNTLNVAPSVVVHLGEPYDTFRWKDTAQNLTVSTSQVNQVHHFLLAVRESSVEVDSIALVKTGADASQARLDSEFGYFEAENHGLTGITLANHAAASGGVRAGGFADVGDRISFGRMPAGRLYIRYSLGEDRPKQASVFVGSNDRATVQFHRTGSWNSYATTFVYLPEAGDVSLRIAEDDYRANGGDSSASIDRLHTYEEGRHCFVTDALALPEKLAVAEPGDTFVLKKGEHRGALELTRSGSADRRITLRAEVAGEVNMAKATVSEAESRLLLTGNYLVVDGLAWFGDPASDLGATTKADYVIKIDEGTSHNRITNVSLSNYNRESVGETLVWVKVDGDHHRVDHNQFVGKKTKGRILYATRPDADEKFHVFDRNYFGPSPSSKVQCAGLSEAECDKNGWEAVMIGTSRDSQSNASCQVKYNLFDGSEGDAETISSKSGNNWYLYNTFENYTQSKFNVRHGNGVLIEGNTFRNSTDGLGFYGEDHVIINNHFENLTNGLYILGGQPVLEEPEGLSCYYPSKRVTVAHNTFANVTNAILIKPGFSCDGGRAEPEAGTAPPKQIVVANNFVTGVTQTLTESTSWYQDASPEVFHFSNCSAESSSSFSKPGWTRCTPSVFVDSDGITRPNPGGALQDAAATKSEVDVASPSGYPDFPAVDLDWEGERRSDPDIGANEFRSTSARVTRVLTRQDVGPEWGTDPAL